MQVQARINKEALRVEKLKQVKMNSLQQAEQDLQKIHQKMVKDQKNQATALKKIKERQELEEHTREKWHTKRGTVLDRFNQT
jgi:hypothetical protein